MRLFPYFLAVRWILDVFSSLKVLRCQECLFASLVSWPAWQIFGGECRPLGLCRRPLPEMPRLRCRWIHGTPGVAHNGFPEILCLPESAMQCVPASSIEVTFSYTPPPTTRLVRCIQSFDGFDLQAAFVLSMAGPVIPTSRTACCSFFIGRCHLYGSAMEHLHRRLLWRRRRTGSLCYTALGAWCPGEACRAV